MVHLEPTDSVILQEINQGVILIGGSTSAGLQAIPINPDGSYRQFNGAIKFDSINDPIGIFYVERFSSSLKTKTTAKQMWRFIRHGTFGSTTQEIYNQVINISNNNYVGVLGFLGTKGGIQFSGQGFYTIESPLVQDVITRFHSWIGRDPSNSELQTAFPNVNISDPVASVKSDVIVITQPESVIDSATTQSVINEQVGQGVLVQKVDLGNVDTVTSNLNDKIQAIDDLYNLQEKPNYPVQDEIRDPRVADKNVTEELTPKPPTGLLPDLGASNYFGVPNWVWIIIVIVIIVIIYKVAK